MILDEFHAGDTADLALTVTPDGGAPTDDTTVATVRLVDPTGVERAPTATPDPGRARWVARLDELLPGEYIGEWTVTGTGAGVQPVTLLVAPRPRAGGRTYATTGDLAEHLRAAPPAGAHRLLVAATVRVDELLRTAVYDVDEQGAPTDPTIRAALVEATCAQAAWLDATGDDGSGLAERYTDVQIGSVRMSTGGRRDEQGRATGPDPRYAPGAVAALRAVPRLFGRAPRVVW